MAMPDLDIRGRAFTERDRKLLGLLLRPEGASLERINRAKATDHSYSSDSARLAERLGGTSWSKGEGSTRRFGIRLPPGRNATLGAGMLTPGQEPPDIPSLIRDEAAGCGAARRLLENQLRLGERKRSRTLTVRRCVDTDRLE
jgi:hypothetical protein